MIFHRWSSSPPPFDTTSAAVEAARAQPQNPIQVRVLSEIDVSTPRQDIPSELAAALEEFKG